MDFALLLVVVSMRRIHQYISNSYTHGVYSPVLLEYGKSHQNTQLQQFKQGGVTGSVWDAYPFKDTLRKVWAMLLLLLLLAPLS